MPCQLSQWGPRVTHAQLHMSLVRCACTIPIPNEPPQVVCRKIIIGILHTKVAGLRFSSPKTTTSRPGVWTAVHNWSGAHDIDQLHEACVGGTCASCASGTASRAAPSFEPCVSQIPRLS